MFAFPLPLSLLKVPDVKRHDSEATRVYSTFKIGPFICLCEKFKGKYHENLMSFQNPKMFV